MVIDAVLAALAGAFCYALAAVLQHHEAERATAPGMASPRLLWQLAHRPLWLAGIAATGLGAGLHLFALSEGPLTLVQPLGVTGLVFAVPLAAQLRHHRVRPRELAAALGVLAGLGALVGALPGGQGTPDVGLEPIAGLLVIAGVLTLAAVAAARVVSGRPRPLLLAVGAGIAFGATSALARVLLQADLQPGQLPQPPALLAGAAIALLAPLGFLLTQSAYRAGGVALALATVTVVDPLIAVATGILLLHEPHPTAPAQTLAIGAGALLITAGIAVLARSPAHGPAQPSPDRSTRPKQTSSKNPRRDPVATMPVSTCPTVPPDDASPSLRGLRILIGTDTYHPDVNGAAYFTYRLATGLAARGHDVHVVCPSPNGPAETRREDGVTVHQLRSVPTGVHPTFRVCLPPQTHAVSEVLRSVAPDVVHVQGHFPIGRSVLRAARRNEIPVVATNHFMPENLLAYARIPAAARRIACTLAWHDFTRAFNRADQITTPTPIAADLIRDKGLRPPIRPISCGIDLARFHTHHPAGRTVGLFGLPDKPTLLFVGRLDEEKHLHELISALPTVRAHVDAQIVIVGSGTQRARLAVLASRLDVLENVHFLGFIPDQQLPSVYAAADVFVMPGIAELQSLATLEAMASGLPVIAADAMALPHLVHPGINGYLYRPGNIEELASYGEVLLTSSQERGRMGRASREIAQTHDETNTLRQFENLYAGLRHRSPTTHQLIEAAR